MKKSNIVTIIGTFTIITVLICTTGKKIPYEKQKCFNDINEIIETLNSKPLAAIDKDNGEIIFSNNMKECFSKRKRIVDSGLDFENLDISINNSQTEDYIKETVEFYKTLKRNMINQDLPERISYAYVTGMCNDVYDSSYSYPISMDLIFIDEGEGWVIDYVNIKK
ncbi:MAG: hypothetical protein E7214_03450 [Clostridium sp.]|nr:hypothetical protein [Clostridium sp.]